MASFSEDGQMLGSDSPGIALTGAQRTEIPVVDLEYVPPIAVLEASTPLEALTAMFTGSDGVILAAAGAWNAAAARVSAAAESLSVAVGVVAESTRGAAFDALTVAINDTIDQARTLASNAAEMGAAMVRLPEVRAGAQVALAQLQAESQARSAAVVAAGAVNPGAVAAGLAAAEVQERAEVAAFVSGFLQPALDTVRPTVTNLGTAVAGHAGGMGLMTGATSVDNWNPQVTEVSGLTAGSGYGTSTAQSAGGVNPTTGTAQPLTAPAGHATGVASESMVPAQPVDRQAGVSGTAPGTNGVGALPGIRQSGVDAASVDRSGSGPAASGTRASGRFADAGRGVRGAVVQPLLPSSLTRPPSPGPGPGAPGGVGTAVPGPVLQLGQGAEHGSPQGNQGGARTAGTGGSGGAPMGPGHAGGQGSRSGRGTASAFRASARGRNGHAVREYFRRQLLGRAPRTVKSVFR